MVHVDYSKMSDRTCYRFNAGDMFVIHNKVSESDIVAVVRDIKKQEYTDKTSLSVFLFDPNFLTCYPGIVVPEDIDYNEVYLEYVHNLVFSPIGDKPLSLPYEQFNNKLNRYWVKCVYNYYKGV